MNYLQSSVRHLLILVFVTIMYIALNACSASIDRSFAPLADQGLLPLSSDNAYNGANLFLASEAEKSSYLYNFLQNRGGPAAIQIQTSGRSTPELSLYYPLKQEYFIADRVGEESSEEWVVRGPFQMERRDYRELAGLASSLTADPVFVIQGKEMRFRFIPVVEPAEVIRPVIPSPLPTRAPKPKASAQTAPNTTHQQSSSGDPYTENGQFRPLNSDQLAIALSQGYAERLANGDIVHTVKSETESLDAIARWYTGTSKHVKEIAQESAVDPAKFLTVGQRLRIPFSLAKQFKSMPADFK